MSITRKGSFLRHFMVRFCAIFAGCVAVTTPSVLLADDPDVLSEDSTSQNFCVYGDIGTYSSNIQMVPVYVPTVYNCNPGYYLPASTESCAKCLANSYCPGGDYTYSANAAGITSCPAGTFARAGMWEAAQCGRILHIGTETLYLRATRKTTPALLVDVNRDGTPDFFANMTTNSVPLNSGTNRSLKVSYGNTVYSLYDDSVETTGANSPIVIPAQQ